MYRIFVLWHRLEDCHPEGGARESRLMSLKNKGAWAASLTELTSLSLRVITMWWSMTMRKPNHSLAIPRSLFSKKVIFFFSTNKWNYVKYHTFPLLSVFWILSSLLYSSVCRGWDQDRSSEASLIGQTAADAVNAARPEEIHQVSLHFYYPATSIPSIHLIHKSWHISYTPSLLSFWFLWCLSLCHC